MAYSASVLQQVWAPERDALLKSLGDANDIIARASKTENALRDQLHLLSDKLRDTATRKCRCNVSSAINSDFVGGVPLRAHRNKQETSTQDLSLASAESPIQSREVEQLRHRLRQYERLILQMRDSWGTAIASSPRLSSGHNASDRAVNAEAALKQALTLLADVLNEDWNVHRTRPASHVRHSGPAAALARELLHQPGYSSNSTREDSSTIPHTPARARDDMRPRSILKRTTPRSRSRTSSPFHPAVWPDGSIPLYARPAFRSGSGRDVHKANLSPRVMHPQQGIPQSVWPRSRTPSRGDQSIVSFNRDNIDDGVVPIPPPYSSKKGRPTPQREKQHAGQPVGDFQRDHALDSEIAIRELAASLMSIVQGEGRRGAVVQGETDNQASAQGDSSAVEPLAARLTSVVAQSSPSKSETASPLAGGSASGQSQPVKEEKHMTRKDRTARGFLPLRPVAASIYPARSSATLNRVSTSSGRETRLLKDAIVNGQNRVAPPEPPLVGVPKLRATKVIVPSAGQSAHPPMPAWMAHLNGPRPSSGEAPAGQPEEVPAWMAHLGMSMEEARAKGGIHGQGGRAMTHFSSHQPYAGPAGGDSAMKTFGM